MVFYHHFPYGFPMVSLWVLNINLKVLSGRRCHLHEADQGDDSDAFSPHLTCQFGEEHICLVGGLEPWNFNDFV